MRYRIYRHLRALAAAETSAEPPPKRPEMTWKDHLVMLLHIGAEIEHSLMVQYLYAAYSLGGEQVPGKHRLMVRRWQTSILAVAKEEMGHFLTVQNILTLIGGPINLNREDLPWDVPFYPFPFRLEPLTLDSLACYVYAEMPAPSELVAAHGTLRDKKRLERYRHFEEIDRELITQVAMRRATQGPHRVGALYDEIIKLVGDCDRIPDSIFQEHTFSTQASPDDWGRGYQPDPRLLDAGGSLKPSSQPVLPGSSAHVIIDRVATRKQAVAALKAISKQGEAPIFAFDETDELSHFDRFLEIYQEFDGIKDEGWRPTRLVPTNPTTLNEPDVPDPGTLIAAEHSRQWAGLFNLRYRLLLKYLGHTFRLARVTRADTPNLRAMVMHRVFGEMYNLKTIAGILTRLPLSDEAAGADTPCAGPPFEMPYTLYLPTTDADIWMLYRDLLEGSQGICRILLGHPDAEYHPYLTALFELDGQAQKWIDQVLAGLAAMERYSE
jgi:hypothetical protein